MLELTLLKQKISIKSVIPPIRKLPFSFKSSERFLFIGEQNDGMVFDSNFLWKGHRMKQNVCDDNSAFEQINRQRINERR